MKLLLQTTWPRLLNHLKWVWAAPFRLVSKSNQLLGKFREIASWSAHTGRSGKLAGGLLLVGLVLGTMGNLQAQVNCTVTDYLYLNDPGLGATHKFELLPNVTAGEISNAGGVSPWLPPNLSGITWSPHGLGQDLNGNIYIGQNPGGPIAKFKPDGTLLNPAFINDGGFNFVSKDGYVYVNSTGIAAGTFNNRIARYSLCDGSPAGYIVLDQISTTSYPSSGFRTGPFTDWGLQIAADGTFYVNAGINVPNGTTRNTYIYRFKPTEADWTSNHPTITGHDLGTGPLATGMSTNIQVWGIATDKFNQMYMVVEDAGSFGGTSTYTWILKYDANFTFKGATSSQVTSSSIGGFQGGRGIIYYAPWDLLLVAGGKYGDCIAEIDPHTISYQGALEPNVPGQVPKTLRVASEACPTASVTVDTTICNANVGDRIFLANLVGSCGAPISGSWTATSTTGITFNQCDLSFTVNNLATACGKFQITQAGGSCPGTFTITVNVDFSGVTAPVIAGDQNVCSGLAPAPFTVTTAAKNTGGKPIKYQWQRSITSCTAGFADVTGATSSTYAAPADTKTRYYRVIATADGNCATAAGSCSDTSNCVTLTLVNPTFAITANPGSCVAATNKYVLTGNINITNPISNSMVATLTDGTVTSTLTIPAGATSVPYSLTLGSDGAAHNIKVSTGCGLAQIGYTAPASCAVVCAISISPVANPCDPATNKYSVGGTINLTNNTTGGTATITDGSSTTTVSIAANATSVNFTLPGLTSDGTQHTISVNLPGCGTDQAVYAAPSSCTIASVCSFAATASAGPCDPATNQYSISGTITLTNNTAGGTATITDGSSTTTVSIAANATTASFTLPGLSSDGAAHTVTVSLPGCGADVLVPYTAPTSCTVAPVCTIAISANAGTCDPATNKFTVTGVITLVNAVAGTATITDGSVTTTIVIAAGATSVPYTLAGVTSDGASHTISVNLPGCGTNTTTYTAPASCPCTLAITATPGACVQATNMYTVTGTITVTNAIAGAAVISDGSVTTTVVIPAGATSAPYTLTGLNSDGVSHTITVAMANCGSNIATYTAPVKCLCPVPNCFPTTVTKN